MQKLPVCVICRSVLADPDAGIMILGKAICGACEQKIISLTGHEPDYAVYISGLKKIWCGREA
ncbi:hypothetical protein JCM39194_23780 [Desulfotomaculum varum]